MVSIYLIVTAVIFYILSCILTNYFIGKNAPEFASYEEVLPDTQMWELTAGMGMVPKWVSAIGLLPYPMGILAIILWFI